METILTAEDALKVLDFHRDGRRKMIHTFSTMGPILMGCDITVHSLRDKLKNAPENGIQVSGPNMASMSHSVAVFVNGEGWLFLATQKSFNEIAKRLK